MEKIKNGHSSTETIEKRVYLQFNRIDGKHLYRDAAPEGYVDYRARSRRGGKVFYFNFDLAKEMGLIPKDHSYELNRELIDAILHTFSLQIINEYDIQHGLHFNPSDIRPHKYMATRYLQLQHPNKQGKTSGDGRVIWNGTFKAKNIRWDVSSSGTGATCLSPAVAVEKKFFKTGDRRVGYGNGCADLLDGLCSAVMSEIFHRNQIKTERTLAIVAFKNGTSINIRAYQNLLRPAHFFRYIKIRYYEGLRKIVDYYIDRQVENGLSPKIDDDYQKYEHFLNQITIDFSRAAAQFEMDYIFCWLDWDGDNILTDSAIIDYGSVRQFGLFHHEYRYEDVDRMSTNLLEQKGKAKYIVQTFAQIVDYLITNKMKDIQSFHDDKIMGLFEQEYESEKDKRILDKMGFSPRLQKKMLAAPSLIKDIRAFRKCYTYFEMAKARRGKYKVPDGVNWDAIYCIRNIMRELPKLYAKGVEIVEEKEFADIMIADHASRSDSKLSESRKIRIQEFQKAYWKIVSRASSLSGQKTGFLLKRMANRSAIINRYERITGDSVLRIAGKIIRAWKNMDSEELHVMLNEFVEEQILRPGEFGREAKPQADLKSRISRNLYSALIRTVKEHREGI